MAERFWEIDALRGIAIIPMIAFHALFDLQYLQGISFGLSPQFWFLVPRAIASVFILLVGISLAISSARLQTPEPKKFLKRGLKIFAYGLVITAVTGLLFPQQTILFGILHFIGLSIALSVPALQWKFRALALALPIIAIGSFLQGLSFGFPWLLWLGLKPAFFASFDYFPLLPWFGLVLAGIALGNRLYPNTKRAFAIAELGNKPIVKQLSFLGRHSLKIYFLHQPVLVAAILLLP